VLRTALPVLLCAGLAVAFIWTRTRALGAAYELAEEKRRHDQLTSARPAAPRGRDQAVSPGAGGVGAQGFEDGSAGAGCGVGGRPAQRRGTGG